jgi:uncharacterized protein (TIGR03067 family)
MSRGLILVVPFLLATANAWSNDSGADDLAKMQGDWMVHSMRSEGMDVPADDAQSLFRTIEGDKYTISRYTKRAGQGTFKIDATQSPKTIDSQPTTPPGTKPILGIYEFQGQLLRICNARPGQPRPKNFDAKQYTGHTLIVWEREAK